MHAASIVNTPLFHTPARSILWATMSFSSDDDSQQSYGSQSSQQSDGFGDAADAAMGAQLIVAIEGANVKQTESMCKTSSATLSEDFVVVLESPRVLHPT